MGPSWSSRGTAISAFGRTFSRNSPRSESPADSARMRAAARPTESGSLCFYDIIRAFLRLIFSLGSAVANYRRSEVEGLT